MEKVFAIWFRRDFRLHDNIAFYEILKKTQSERGKWIAIFHLDPSFTKDITTHHDYFFQTVNHFKERLRELGIHLHIITGSKEEFANKLLHQVPKLSALFFNSDEVGYGRVRDGEVASLLISSGIDVFSFTDAHMTSATDIVKKDGTPYQVFTPYFRAWEKIEKPLPVKLDVDYAIKCNQIDDVIDEKGEHEFKQLMKMCKRKWESLGEDEALKLLEQFISTRVNSYERMRDFPSTTGTSRLSPYLKTGTLSIRTVYHMVLSELETESLGVHTFIKELVWREFYHMIYYYHVNAKKEAIQKKYNDIKWSLDQERFQQWCTGKTGFPLVDAGMRQLIKEGWMHNRMRMVTASFLCKDYLIDWRLGEEYFQKMLIDYDEASNIGGWQWAASVGCDAVPYFRIFNPITQSKRFDPNGVYIRKYVEELRNVEDRFIHEPWKMSQKEQLNSNCFIGKDYPEPSVDHQIQRERAIQLFKE